MKSATLICLLGAAALGASLGAAAAQEPSFGKDLTATIVLHGQPCDAVVDAKRNSDSDYTATCRDGNRYHVYVDSNGRVIVQKL
ncbi:MAG TPA: hypothetical protein VEY89_09885 [Candidatus Dormibacteraeota bacterium]|nr:hypothetical protein [Candidatus Dormibacteraeota bacterium]